MQAPALLNQNLCWRYLSSQAVASQVLWTEMSLTTVFGMGTGVPSSQLTPTVFFFQKTFVIITPLRYYVKKKIGDPWENRTPVYGVRGRRLSRLTNGPFPHTV